MSFTRVEQDGVEFYTLKSNGSSGMSISGLARLCKVQDSSINRLLRQIVLHKARSECFKHLLGQDPYLGTKAKYGAKIIRADFCAAIIEYYAFESDVKTAEATFSYRKFAKIGIEAWIQSITGWKLEFPERKTTAADVEKYINDHLKPGLLATAIHPGKMVEMLQENEFSRDAYRIYLYLEMANLQEQRPSIDTICKDLKISESTFKKWLPRIHETSHCADWLEIPCKRQGTEYEIQCRLHQELGGKMEAYTPLGNIDLVTKTEIIEIKLIDDWKTGFGQVLGKSATFPKHAKRLHLFGQSSKKLKKITAACQPFDVVVTFETIGNTP